VTRLQDLKISKDLCCPPKCRYLKINPRGTVPTLVHGQHTIHESVRPPSLLGCANAPWTLTVRPSPATQLLITEYIDDAFFDSAPRLLPSDPYER
jgi:hypothetical protein